MSLMLGSCERKKVSESYLNVLYWRNLVGSAQTESYHSHILKAAP
jgi:hypothetical protein